jgi:hypothetical protein
MIKGLYDKIKTFIFTNNIVSTLNNDNYFEIHNIDPAVTVQDGEYYVTTHKYVSLPDFSANISSGPGASSQIVSFNILGQLTTTDTGYYPVFPSSKLGASSWNGVAPLTSANAKAAFTVIPYNCVVKNLCLKQYQVSTTPPTGTATFYILKVSSSDTLPPVSISTGYPSVVSTGNTLSFIQDETAYNELSVSAGESLLLYVDVPSGISPYIASVSFEIYVAPAV